ncbi:unnamed protein product [Trichogramma brassicae]|uniref:Reverse transcriptase domain-containing protein n=1 Tax=Trichogramma brassicae TaxID=86971 RepID=A0A6H5J102_9HYME|nr:unnamed protein product [Trichogramma brassicae]
MSIRLAVLQRTNSVVVTCSMCRCGEVLCHLRTQDHPNCQALASRLHRRRVDCIDGESYELFEQQRPFWVRAIRLAETLKEAASNELSGNHEPSASDLRSALVLVKKSDGGYRMFIDFSDLNARTVKNAYPEANMDMILDRLRNARFISTIDLKAAFLQVRLNKESRKYTDFAVLGSGLWQFLRMPYGISNSPSTFSRLVDALFGPAYDPHVFTYLDDVIVVTETFADHLKWLKFALSRLVDAGLQINREKCHFCRPRVLYLGF